MISFGFTCQISCWWSCTWYLCLLLCLSYTEVVFRWIWPLNGLNAERSKVPLRILVLVNIIISPMIGCGRRVSVQLSTCFTLAMFWLRANIWLSVNDLPDCSMTMSSHFILRLPLIHLRSYRLELAMERPLTLLVGLYKSFSSRWWTGGLPMGLFWVIVVLKKKTYFQSKINFPRLSVHCKSKHIILHWFSIQSYLAMFGLQSGTFSISL